MSNNIMQYLFINILKTYVNATNILYNMPLTILSSLFFYCIANISLVHYLNVISNT